MTQREYSFGALPPAGFEWQTGKTAGSIQWVRYLEEMKQQAYRRDDSANAQKAIQDMIDALKNGTMVAREFPPDMK